MVKLIFEHFWLKITALLLGIFLWFHVATEKIYNYQLMLPVEEIVLDPELSLWQPPPESLMVVVSATGKQLLRQKWRESGLKITATQFKQGRHRIEFTTANTSLITPSTEVSLDEILHPTSFVLMIDQLVEKRVPVVPDIITEPDEGFALGDISGITPPQVTVTGPRSVVNSVNEVSTEAKELQGLRNNLSLTLPLALPKGYGLSLDPDSVTLTVRVVPVKTRVFEGIPIVVYNAPADKRISHQPSSIRIELTGPPTEIDLLNKNALIASADYAKADGGGRAPIKIDCPLKFRVKNASADSVIITVQ
ncbi:MAG: CdaR family protein [Candidatus Zixiibacteriota bacterium]